MENALKSLTDRQLAVVARDSARQIWLAGLGAYSLAETEGNKLFRSLVTEGESLEGRIRAAAEEKADQVRVKVTHARDKLEQVFEKRVAQALEALAVPVQDDVEALSRKIEELSVRIQALQEGAQEARVKGGEEITQIAV
jgi:poly(hydroxyalkanoate) granule-associated protein